MCVGTVSYTHLYYEKIRQGKQEKLFHEVIFQIGNREDMAVGTLEGNLAVKVLDEYCLLYTSMETRNSGLLIHIRTKSTHPLGFTNVDGKVKLRRMKRCV